MFRFQELFSGFSLALRGLRLGGTQTKPCWWVSLGLNKYPSNRYEERSVFVTTC